MAIAHVLKPAPAQGAAQLFLLFSDAGQPWQGMRPLGEKLAAAFASWQDEHGKALVATEGGKGTPWRISLRQPSTSVLRISTTYGRNPCALSSASVRLPSALGKSTNT